MNENRTERGRCSATTRRALLGGIAGMALASRVTPASAQCTWVELYPGYPGFIGYVTGVDGVGDGACLEELAAANPGFDLAVEDDANAQAAANLGIPGVKEDWTWENWMAVEAARGLPSTCWSCAVLSADARAADPGSLADPRIAIGTINTTHLVNQTGAPVGTVPNDLVLQALVGLAQPFQYLTAPDLLALAPSFVDQYFFNGYLDPNKAEQNLLAQGGYAPVPAGLMADDQVFVYEMGFYAILPFFDGLTQDLRRNRFTRIVDDWWFSIAQDPVNAVSFADWMRSNWN